MNGLWGVIQARMASTRLPGKVLRELAGKPLIWHIADRLRRVPGLDGIVIATTKNPEDDALEAFAHDQRLAVFRHEGVDDIAGRLAGAARLTGADGFLKVNGDCPLVDPDILRRLVERMGAADRPDFVSNKMTSSYPEGLGAEAITTRALTWCDDNLTAPADREYVADWIRDNDGRFAVASITGEHDLGHHGWAVDTPSDFAFAAQVFAELYQPGGCFGMQEVLQLVERKTTPVAVARDA